MVGATPAMTTWCKETVADFGSYDLTSCGFPRAVPRGYSEDVKGAVSWNGEPSTLQPNVNASAVRPNLGTRTRAVLMTDNMGKAAQPKA